LRHASRLAVSFAAKRRPRAAPRVGALALSRRRRDRPAARLRRRPAPVRAGRGPSRRRPAAARRRAHRRAARGARRRAERRQPPGRARRAARRGERLRAREAAGNAGARRRPLRRASRHVRARHLVRAPRRPPRLGVAHMIVTVTLNAAIDRTLTVPNFQRGQRHRASEGLTLAGGKGINIARALKTLGVPVIATGLAGGGTGMRIVEELTAEAILNDFVRIDDDSRTSTAIVDPTGGSYTEVNEWGPRVEPHELDMLREKLVYLSRGADYVIFAGSLPRGVEDDFYADVIRDLNRRGVLTVLDSEGEPLRLAAHAEPFPVSPNERDAESLVGQELHDAHDFLPGLDAIAQHGTRTDLITRQPRCWAQR